MFERKSNFKWGTVIVVCLAVFVVILDVSALNVAITRIIADLNTSLSTVRTTIAFYALVMASFMIMTSKIQDILGRKKTFLIGLTIFGIGTIVSSLSVNIEMLFFGWAILEGSGAALIFPTTTSIIGSSYEGKDKITAFGMWAGIAAMGAAVGPIFGGFFTSFFSWRFTFISEFVMVILIFIFSFYIKESIGKLTWKDFDYKGGILSVFAFILLVLGILLLNYHQYWNLVPVFIILGIALFGIFIWSQNRRMNKGLEPISDVSLLKNRVFDLGSISFILQQIPLAGYLFITPVYLEQVLGLDAFTAGLIILPSSITMMIFALIGSRLPNFMARKYILIIGFIITAVGAWNLGGTYLVNVSPYSIIPGTIVFAVGIGILASQLTDFIMSAASPDQSTDASGLLNTFKNLGYSMGTALIGIVFVVGLIGGITASIESSPMGANITHDEIQTKLYGFAGSMQNLSPQHIADVVSPDQKDLIDNSVNIAFRAVFNFMTALLVIGALISIFLIKKKDV